MLKQVLMIAGPNGAGKTTMSWELIANAPIFYEYLNADEIAKGLAPLHPESVALSASKLMINRLIELLDANKSFAFETTASGTNYINLNFGCISLKFRKIFLMIFLFFFEEKGRSPFSRKKMRKSQEKHLNCRR